MVQIPTDILNSEYVTWITFLSIIGTMFGVFFAVYKYIVFKIESRKLDFIKQIEYYEKELLHTRRIFVSSDHTYLDCKNECEDTLIILERLAYFGNNNMIKPKTLQYFQFWFNLGIVLCDWLEMMENRKMQFNYPEFYAVKDKIKYTCEPFRLHSSYGYFYNNKKINPNYDPWQDTKDLTKYQK